MNFVEQDAYNLMTKHKRSGFPPFPGLRAKAGPVSPPFPDLPLFCARRALRKLGVCDIIFLALEKRQKLATEDAENPEMNSEESRFSAPQMAMSGRGLPGAYTGA